MGLFSNLEKDLRAIIMANLPYDTNNEKTASELKFMDISNLAIVYFNWINRLLPAPEPRKVFISEECKKNPLYMTFQEALLDIQADINKGNLLTYRLSEQVAKYGYDIKTRKKRRQDLDLLLNDWNIYHLNLGITPYLKDPRFCERTNELLFIIFKDEEAFFLIFLIMRGFQDSS